MSIFPQKTQAKDDINEDFIIIDLNYIHYNNNYSYNINKIE